MSEVANLVLQWIFVLSSGKHKFFPVSIINNICSTIHDSTNRWCYWIKYMLLKGLFLVQIKCKKIFLQHEWKKIWEFKQKTLQKKIYDERKTRWNGIIANNKQSLQLLFFHIIRFSLNFQKMETNNFNSDLRILIFLVLGITAAAAHYPSKH